MSEYLPNPPDSPLNFQGMWVAGDYLYWDTYPQFWDAENERISDRCHVWVDEPYNAWVPIPQPPRDSDAPGTSPLSPCEDGTPGGTGSRLYGEVTDQVAVVALSNDMVLARISTFNGGPVLKWHAPKQALWVRGDDDLQPIEHHVALVGGGTTIFTSFSLYNRAHFIVGTPGEQEAFGYIIDLGRRDVRYYTLDLGWPTPESFQYWFNEPTNELHYISDWDYVGDTFQPTHWGAWSWVTAGVALMPGDAQQKVDEDGLVEPLETEQHVDGSTMRRQLNLQQIDSRLRDMLTGQLNDGPYPPAGGLNEPGSYTGDQRYKSNHRWYITVGESNLAPGSIGLDDPYAGPIADPWWPVWLSFKEALFELVVIEDEVMPT